MQYDMKPVPKIVHNIHFRIRFTMSEIWMQYSVLQACLLGSWKKLNFFPFFLYSLPSLLCLNTEFSEHLQYPQMGIHHFPTILPGPGFNRAFIQSDQVWPDQELWNRFLCEPLWDGFLGLDFCGNVPSGNTTTSFTSFPSLGSPLETKVCYHFYSATVGTKLIFGERKWGMSFEQLKINASDTMVYLN